MKQDFAAGQNVIHSPEDFGDSALLFERREVELKFRDVGKIDVGIFVKSLWILARNGA